jgi:hypothetical protein
MKVIPPERQRLMGRSDEIRALETDLRRYPPLLAYVERFVSDPDRYDRDGLKDPTDLMGDRAFHAISALLGLWDGSDEVRLSLARTIISSVPVLWPDAMWEAARSLPLPSHVVAPDAMPYPLMWWRFAHSYGESGALTSMLVMTDPEVDGITVGIFGHPGESGEIQFNGWIEIPFRSRYPEDFPENGSVEIVLQMLAFMNSRYVKSDGEPLPRAERRRIERAGLTTDGLDADHPVHVIKLRAPEPSPVTAAADGDREWSHRWFVRGHYRAQWYPSIQAHRVRWIAAYVKGPEGKPIQLPAVKVQQ